jgi:glycolate oxidase FAD binding subunit
VISAATSADVEALCEQVRAARARGTPLRIVGAGTWLDAGRPCDATERLEIGALAGIVTYEPGDLTLTARAGTSLDEIERVTAAEGQWLPMTPMGSPRGTLGATMATASAGPLASAYGTPRDHVLGCAFVSGAGELLRGGGHVVKNVAGFDLVRLVTGAWGTLGALTEVSVRLRARPEVDRTLAVAVVAETPTAIADAAWRWLRDSEYTPLAGELLSPRLSAALGMDGSTLLVRLGGNSAYVRGAFSAVESLGPSTPMETAAWSMIADAESPGALVVRASTLPSRIGALWARAASLAESAGGFAHATVARGVVRCVLPADMDAVTLEAVREQLAMLSRAATIVGERLPQSLWNVLPHAHANAALSSGVRAAFDPDRILNPGILGADA